MRIAASDEKAVRIMAVGERDGTDVYTLPGEPAGERLRRSLAAAVRIGIKGQVDGSWTVTELPVLVRVELIPHGTGDVMKTGLP